MYLYVDSRLATDIFENRLKKISSALVGMSIFLGLYAFGSQGIIYGPLLVSMGYTIYEIGNSIGLDENENIFFIEDSKET